MLSSSGQLGVPRVDKPQLTQVQPFNLLSDSRAKVRRSHEHPSAEQAAAAAKFRAQPVKKSILDGPVSGVCCCTPASLCQPHIRPAASSRVQQAVLLIPLRVRGAVQTFKPHKEKHEATVPKSPLLRTRLRSHAGVSMLALSGPAAVADSALLADMLLRSAAGQRSGA